MLTMMRLRQLLGAVLSGGLFQDYFLSFLVMSSACGTSFLSRLFPVTLLTHAPRCFEHPAALSWSSGERLWGRRSDGADKH